MFGGSGTPTHHRSRSSMSNGTGIFARECLEWTNNEVCSFLNEINLSQFIPIFQNNNIHGKHLYVLSNDILKEMGIYSLSHRLDLLAEIELVHRNNGMMRRKPRVAKWRTMSEEERIVVVIQKLKKQIAGEVDPKELEEKARSLVNKEMLKERYLNKDFTAIRNMLEEQIKETQGIPSGTSKKNRSLLSSRPQSEDDYSSVPTPSKPGSSIKDASIMHIAMDQYKLRENIKIKLVIGEIAHGQGRKMLRQFTAPLISTFDKGPTFGMFHSAIILGPWYLEWNSSSLAIPRKCYSSSAVIAVDLDNYISKMRIDDVIEKISDVIIEWNSTKTYDQSNANCQTFVDDIMRSLGLELKFGGVMQRCLEKLRTKGKCTLSYRPPKKLREQLSLPEKVTFKTHQELDDLCDKLLKAEPLFNEKYRDDYFLLKSFDRAFWLRSYKSHDVTFMSKSCHFGDPRNRSLMKDWF